MTDACRGARGNQLRHWRHVRGLPLWAVAVRAGTSATVLSAIERWNYRPGADLQARIAAALEVNVVDIWPEGEQRA
jgi:lambda repressor-like predicted transcriptional regulator